MSKHDDAKSYVENLGAVAANTFDHIILTDPSGKIVYANKSAEKTTGYELSEMIGNTPRLWGGLMPKTFYEELWNTIHNEKGVFVGEVKNRRKDGEEYIAQVNITPVLDKNDEIVFFAGIERDITRLKRLEKTKLEFVTLASHQLRTPLSTINWYSEVLKNGEVGPLSENQQHYVEEIYRASQRMTNLVNDLLNLSRIDMDKVGITVSNFDIKKLINTVVKEHEPLYLEKKISLHINVSKKISNISSDKQVMNIAITNLLTNAIKYTPSKGSIEISFAQQGDQYVLEVKDTGYGIPNEEKSMIFSKFFRATNAMEKSADGTGLGLYIIKSFVENIGGNISYITKLNEGTVFTVQIPVDINKMSK